jgi:release factor glutamine methyltransferase
MQTLPGLKARLAKQEPIQYILGEADFYSLKFKVSPAVLIPRQETEELVALFREHHKKSSTASILDIGTGSACIPVTIKYSHPRTKFTAIDVSPDALDIAQYNRDRHQQKIDLKQIDFCDPAQRSNLGNFDIIISNPPYIGIEEAEKLEQNVIAYEPHVALFSPNKDANFFYRLIYAFSKSHLIPKGNVYLELNEFNAQEVKEIFEQGDFDIVKIVKDIHQKDRILFAVKS